MLWNGQVMWGMMLYDNRRLLDYMCDREDVDASRVATIGMSMGGLMAWWLAALDERVKVTVDICGQVDAGTLIAKRGLDHHGFYSYVPGLLEAFYDAGRPKADRAATADEPYRPQRPAVSGCRSRVIGCRFAGSLRGCGAAGALADGRHRGRPYGNGGNAGGLAGVFVVAFAGLTIYRAHSCSVCLFRPAAAIR